jgi:hypothetical protein
MGRFSMATQKFSGFVRPEAGRLGPITDRDLDILDAVLRQRPGLHGKQAFCDWKESLNARALSKHAVPDRDFRPVFQPLWKKWRRMVSAIAGVKGTNATTAT